MRMMSFAISRLLLWFSLLPVRVCTCVCECCLYFVCPHARAHQCVFFFCCFFIIIYFSFSFSFFFNFVAIACTRAVSACVRLFPFPFQFLSFDLLFTLFFFLFLFLFAVFCYKYFFEDLAGVKKKIASQQANTLACILSCLFFFCLPCLFLFIVHV